MTEEQMTGSQKIWREVMDWGKTIVVAIIVASLINYFGGIAVVNGESMQHTLENQDLLLLNKCMYKRSGIERGDIIAFKTNMQYPSGLYQKLGYTKNLVKRVIGVAGDEIVVKDGEVFRNGQKLVEPYLKDGITDKEFSGVVPEGCIFAMGDNRLNSNDSRGAEVGFIPVDKVIGKAFFRLFPFNQFGKL